MTITSKIDGKDISLVLTQLEVATAISICEKSSIEEVITMKHPHKGGALFFDNPQRAAACQDRHNFAHSFTIKKSALLKFKPGDPPPPPVDKNAEAVEKLKSEVAELRETIADNAKVVEAAGDKDTEIELLKEEVAKIAGLETKLSEASAELARVNGVAAELTETNAKLVEENTKLKK